MSRFFSGTFFDLVLHEKIDIVKTMSVFVYRS